MTFVVTSEITLAPNVGSDRSWVYSTAADFSEGQAKTELFAIRFANSESKLLPLLITTIIIRCQQIQG